MAHLSFIQELKNADNENPYLKDVSDEQWEGAIDDSLLILRSPNKVLKNQ